jgi:hypothetical protein
MSERPPKFFACTRDENTSAYRSIMHGFSDPLNAQAIGLSLRRRQ